MRFQIRFMLKEGATDLQVLSLDGRALRARRCCLDPPVNPVTFLLWAGAPILMLLMIGMMIGRRVSTIPIGPHRRR